MAAAATIAVVGVRTGFSQNNNNFMENNKVKNIKPLGFQWETRDPFLFCVHH